LYFVVEETLPSSLKMIIMRLIITAFILAFVTVGLNSQNTQELGQVDWLRSYDTAIAESKASDKPILILFQEVPGCATCRNYGDNVLSHPLLVDVIEHYFVPLAIFNNKGGEDKKILNKYKEPTWNNPVVRIVDERGDNLIDRINGNYSSQVVYDDRLISEKQLTKKGEASRCADGMEEGSKGFRKDKDPKYYLKHSAYNQLPMHPLQAARINSLLGEGIKDVSAWLFPSQKKWMAEYAQGKSKMVLYDEDFEEAWEVMLGKMD